ncbi:hypothetical protein K6119_05275 [Paracrocinitomix mangrovi]|uniref:hypothetical protein n=1 Tax=Paracrocinitomix mangrovi TaxID=2862509 RepID=UPI001C8E2060|nr:hypothetical protein [Paracrocinitomix mangrovi]UKN02925.1 hypothetical protein K6119_05275 [Paracrocinitomix mangrovi]
MKKSIFLFFLAVFAMSYASVSYADSPLTSTPFWQAYEDVKEVKHAKENGLDKKALKWILSDKIGCDVKLAMINSFGWESGYTQKFEDALIENREGLTKDVFKYLKSEGEDMPEETEQTRLLTTDDLVCWSYLRAMDNYNTPQYSMKGAFIAYWRDSKNMASGVVWCLVVSQMHLFGDWCQIYESGQTFIKNAKYENNLLKDEAVTIIMEYLNLYEQDCE